MDAFSKLQRGLNRAIRSQPWILMAVPAASAVGLFLFFQMATGFLRGPFGLASARDLGEGVGTFLTVIGVIYALIIGFTYQQGFARQDELRHTMTSEAGSLRNVLLLCESLRVWNQRQVLAGTLREYVDRLLAQEFPPAEQTSPDPAATLYQIVPLLNRASVDGISDAVDRVTLNAIHDELRAATRARSQRLAVARRHIPRIHWFQIELLSTLILVGYMLLDLNAPVLEATLFSLTGGAIFVLYMSLFDIDYPFDGLWQVSPDTLRAVREELVVVEREKPAPTAEER